VQSPIRHEFVAFEIGFVAISWQNRLFSQNPAQ
jgi:hypothetical protein